VRFPTKAWLDALVAALNRQPDLAKAMAGLGAADAGAVVERDAGLPREVAAYGRNVGGRIEARLLPDADDLLELEPAYVVRAPYGVWKQLLRGAVDPVKAAMSGRVKVEGDLERLVRQASFRYVVDTALREVGTEFVDEEDGR
jgi:hypothetical protein